MSLSVFVLGVGRAGVVLGRVDVSPSGEGLLWEERGTLDQKLALARRVLRPKGAAPGTPAPC